MKRWVALGLGVVVVAALALFLVRRDSGGSGPEEACRTVVRAVREASDNKRSPESVLEVVRAQVPVAQAAAAKDPDVTPIAVAIEEMRVNMEAGRPWPSVVVLYQRCG